MSDYSIKMNDDILDVRHCRPITITPPLVAPHKYRVTLEFDPLKHVLNVQRIPSWFKSGDVIEYRRGRTFAVSMTETEPRWKQWWRKLKARLSGV